MNYKLYGFNSQQEYDYALEEERIYQEQQEAERIAAELNYEQEGDDGRC